MTSSKINVPLVKSPHLILKKHKKAWINFIKFDVNPETKKIFFVDYSSLFEYRGEAYRIYEWLSENQKNFFLVFTSYPSAFVKSGRAFLSENGRNIYYNASGTTVLLELCDSEKC